MSLSPTIPLTSQAEMVSAPSAFSLPSSNDDSDLCRTPGPADFESQNSAGSGHYTGAGSPAYNTSASAAESPKSAAAIFSGANELSTPRNTHRATFNPTADNILYYFDKLPFVIDLGNSILKAGLAGDNEPACILCMQRLCSFREQPLCISNNNSNDCRSDTSRSNNEKSILDSDGDGNTNLEKCSLQCSGIGGAYVGGDQMLVPSLAMLTSPAASQAKSRVLLATNTETYTEMRWRLRRLLDFLFFKSLRLTPYERKVVICEQLLTSEREKLALIDILFTDYEVPAVSLIPALVSPLYCCGVDFGLVVDIGCEETRLLATAGGCAILRSLVSLRTGGASVDRELRKLLLEAFADNFAHQRQVEQLSSQQLENLKIACCYVRYTADRRRRENTEDSVVSEKDRVLTTSGENHTINFLSGKDVLFRCDDAHVLRIPAAIRWKACEVFFSSGVAEATSCYFLHEALAECLLRCPADVRPLVVQNIVLCGGSAQFRGFTTRLAVEFDGLLASERNELQPLRPLIKLGVPCISPLLRAWTGASLHASLEGRLEYTREEYEQGIPVPDWTTWNFSNGMYQMNGNKISKYPEVEGSSLRELCSLLSLNVQPQPLNTEKRGDDEGGTAITSPYYFEN